MLDHGTGMNEVVAVVGERQLACVGLDEADSGVAFLQKRRVLEAGRRDVRLVWVPGLEIVRMVVKAVIGHTDVQDIHVGGGRQRLKETSEHALALALGNPRRQ